MVAFVCGRPAMYRTPNGWVKDDSTDCLVEPVDILNYCRKVYPTKDVRNIVEWNKMASIGQWCGFGHNKCHHEFTVRPFRCLIGAFQSDALLVPEHCLFDHIHESKECKSYTNWNETSSRSCKDRGMVHHSLAILQPCGIARFNGVEFVCCPHKDDVDDFLEQAVASSTTPSAPATSTPAGSTTTPGPWVDEDSDEDYDDEEEDEDFSSEEEEEEEDDLDLDNMTPNDIYNKYLHNSRSQYVNEHEYFIKAKNDLQKHHHEKVTKMMKEWAEARQRVQDLKSFDPKGAEQLNKDITARFQKTYQALEQEGLAERRQLVGLHQQRVQAELNEKKRHAMEHYMKVLTDDGSDAALILKALQHYIKTEQKDRLHTINHFQHVKDSDPAEAESIRQQNLDHLDLIQARIQQAIDMLRRIPKYEKKIRSQIEDYLRTFRPLDVSITEMMAMAVEAAPPSDAITLPKDVDFSREDEAEDSSEEDLYTAEDSSEEEDEEEDSEEDEDYEDSEEDSDEDEDSASDDDDDDEEVATEDQPPVAMATDAPQTPEEPELHKVALHKDGLKVDKFDDEVMENEHDYVEIEAPSAQHVAHFADNGLEVKSYIQREPISENGISGATLAVAIGSITVFVVIVVGIVLLRRRAQRVPVSQGFVEVDHQGAAASPEERHVTNMQINGYENPTYRYFEMNQGGASSA